MYNLRHDIVRAGHMGDDFWGKRSTESFGQSHLRLCYGCSLIKLTRGFGMVQRLFSVIYKKGAIFHVESTKRSLLLPQLLVYEVIRGVVHLCRLS